MMNLVTLRQKLVLSGLLWALAIALTLLNALPFYSLVGIIIFTVLLYGYRATSDAALAHNAVWLLLVVTGFAVAVYWPPGFTYPTAFSVPALYEGGDPFVLVIETGKALAGYIALVWLFSTTDKRQAVVTEPGTGIVVAVGGIAVVLASAVALLELSWTPKWSSATLKFALVNLLLTVVAEETFFRLILQRHISNWFNTRWIAMAVSIPVTALVFTLAHDLPFGTVFAVYLIAGLVYATVFALTQRLGMAILVHFGVNILHFLFLEYPLPARLWS